MIRLDTVDPLPAVLDTGRRKSELYILERLINLLLVGGGELEVGGVPAA